MGGGNILGDMSKRPETRAQCTTPWRIFQDHSRTIVFLRLSYNPREGKDTSAQYLPCSIQKKQKNVRRQPQQPLTATTTASL